MTYCTAGRMFLAIAAAALAPYAAVAIAAANQAPPAMLSGQTRRLSPSVVGTILTRGDDLELMVLWRGSPGWFGGTGQRGTHGSGSGATLAINLDFAAVRLRMTYDATSHALNVQGKPVSLAPDDNVVLVDRVDGAEPYTIEVTAMDGQLRGENPTLATLVSRSPMIVAFLRCDAGTPNEMATRAINRLVCDDLKRK